ncbi:MAG: NERD domain-containing protein [Flavobacteriales bacterium]
MLEIRKGTASKNYENTFFREFAENLKNLFDKYSLNGLLIANSECETEKRLQIDALLVTKNAVCIIDFKNFDGKITLPRNAKSEFEFGRWTNQKGDTIKGGSSINPFVQLKNQKEKFIRVYDKNIKNKLPKSDLFNPFHTVRAVCFQKEIELIGSIPSKEELNFFIIDKSNYLEKIRDIIDISDKEVSLSNESFNVFKEVFRADKFDLNEMYEETVNYNDYSTELDFDNLYSDQKSALKEITTFIKSEEEQIFILQGTSLSGKTHLIPFIQDIAFNNNISEVKLFASSARIANNLLKNSNLEFNSMYSQIYGGTSQDEDIIETDENDKETIDLEIVPLKKCDDVEETVFIIDESQLISDNYHQSIDLRFGSGKLLEDFITFSDLKNTKRKLIFVGDSFQLSIGKKEESALNPAYLEEKYECKTRAFQLIDKESKSEIVKQALSAVNCIRQKRFNNLSFKIGETFKTLEKEDLLPIISNSLKNNSNAHLLSFSNYDAQKINFWIKKSILKNGTDLSKNDLMIFSNNIRVEDENDPFAEPKKIYNGQFGTVTSASEPIVKTNLKTNLTFREVNINLQDTGHNLKFFSFENFRLSDKGELSKDETISYKILLNQLAEKELENFKSGKLHSDDELTELLKKLENGERVKTKVNRKIQKLLSNIPSSEFYKYKNSAQLRFGWALTVHKAMSYKWDEVFFNVETGGGKTNETYFKWIYTGLIRATHKVNLINYKSINPFIKMDIKPSTIVQKNDKKLFFVSDLTADLSVSNKDIAEKFNFPNEEITSSLLQLQQFVNSKLQQNKLKVNAINHPNYQELYEVKGSDGEIATISIYYNKKGQFKRPTLMKSEPKVFGEEVIEVLTSNNSIIDFEFIKDDWRKSAYKDLKIALNSNDMDFAFIIQGPYKDTIKIKHSENALIVDMYYDGDGFYSSISASYYDEPSIWTSFQEILNKLKS